MLFLPSLDLTRWCCATLLCLLLALGPSVSHAEQALPPLPLREGLRVYVEQGRELFPDIRLYDAEGKQTRLSESHGKVRLLNFWATWCVPCVRELPELSALQERYPDTLQVMTVNQDKEGFAAIIPFLEKHQLRGLAHYWDKYSVEYGKLRMRGLPTSFLIDAKGNLVATIQGKIDWLGADMEGLIGQSIAR